MKNIFMKGLLWCLMGVTTTIGTILAIVLEPVIIIIAILQGVPVWEFNKEVWTTYFEYVGEVAEDIKDM